MECFCIMKSNLVASHDVNSLAIVFIRAIGCKYLYTSFSLRTGGPPCMEKELEIIAMSSAPANIEWC